MSYIWYVGAFWLGCSLSMFTDADFKSWQFYAITVPTLILFEFGSRYHN